jgi:hypothetical protein
MAQKFSESAASIDARISEATREDRESREHTVITVVHPSNMPEREKAEVSAMAATLRLCDRFKIMSMTEAATVEFLKNGDADMEAQVQREEGVKGGGNVLVVHTAA